MLRTARLRDEPDESLPDYRIRAGTDGLHADAAVFAGADARFTRPLAPPAYGSARGTRSA